MKLKALLVGTGWGRFHAQAYAQCENIELAGVCGYRNREKLDALADEFGGVPRGMDLAGLLREVKPDVLDVACNPHLRLDAVRAALEAPSVKLVNLEKPMALVPSDAYAIRDLCQQRGILLTVNHQKKYLPAWRKVRRLIDAGALGEISFIRATCQGNLLEQGTHLVDMVMYYNGFGPIDWVMGQVADLEGLDKAQAAAPDAAIASIAFRSGVRALIETGTVGRNLPGETNKWHQFAVEVYGSEGHARVTLNKTLEVWSYADGGQTVEASSWDDEFVNAIAAHLDDVALYAIDPERGHISDLTCSMRSFDAVMAIYASACYGGRVELPAEFGDRLIDDLKRMR